MPLTKRSGTFPNAKKSLGQNFLIDKNIARKIVDAVPAKAGQTVLEIGPGRGILTECLLAKNLQVIAVELDSFYAEYLTDIFKNYTSFKLIHRDFLKIDLLQICKEPFHIVGNLPYSITSPVLFKLIQEKKLILSATLMMQREVAERIIGVPRTKNYGILSVWVQAFASVRLVLKAPPDVFRPRPRVESAVIQLKWKNDAEQILKNDVYFLKLIKSAFQKRRKVLRNALKGFIPPEIQNAIHFDFARRAEEVPVEEWIMLSNRLQNMKRS